MLDRAPRTYLLILAVSIAAVFAQVATFHFATFDDALHLYQNPHLTNPFFFWKGPFNGYFIPITYTLWSTAARLSTSPAIFHVLNLVFHFGSVFFVYSIFRRLGIAAAASALAAGFFALHPLQVESVAWISSFTGVLCAFFSLASVHAYLCRRRGVATALYVLALLSKPGALVVPFVLLLIDYGFRRKSDLRLILVWVALALPTSWIVRAQQSTSLPFATPLEWRPFIALDAIRFYTLKLVAPFSLGPNNGRTPELVMQSVSRLWIGLFALGMAAGLWWKRKNRVAAAAVGIFIVSLLPTSGLVPFYYQTYSTVADRYAYLALAGPALWLATWLGREKWKWGVATALLVFYAGMSVYLTEFWKNDVTLLDRVVRIHPTSTNHQLLAQMLDVEASGKNPMPGSPPRPLSIPRTPSEIATHISRITFHYEEALRLDPTNKVAREQYERFLKRLQ